ncbi:uncharacterized protein LOC117289176 [Asterias rubens]|uniref:uncharacterized protein LOC117289176 n=1 Tax=Asterias rubens TaxID=7604 RepID=UPI0014556F38|nr:uncharacterized protein LOC117289176 [Asterias rubens]
MMDNEHRTTETLPKGEVPTEAEFARFLCDKTFVDYFNTFLSLPVFSQRLVYRFSEQTFELDPPIKRTQYRLDRLKLMRWLRTQRAPLFFKTDLYLEYLLCKQLQKTQLHLSCPYGLDQTGAKDRMLDRRLMYRWLSRVSGMRKFRLFLEQTAGEKALHFWLDAERFRKTTNCHDEHRELFRQMEAKYFKHGGMFELPEHAKWLASIKPEDQNEPASVAPRPHQRERRQSHFIVSGVEVESHLPGGSLYGVSHEWLIAPDAFVVIQGFFLKTLQNYWVPRYLLHAKAKWLRHQPRARGEVLVYRPDSFAVRVRSLSDLVGDGEDENAVDFSTKAKQVVRAGSRLKKQSALNLLSMFSSPGMRRSEMAAILKLEDSGETIGGKPRDETDLVGVSGGEGWKTEDFPLPTISEEEEKEDSIASVESRGLIVSPTPSPEQLRSVSVSPVKSTQGEDSVPGAPEPRSKYLDVKQEPRSKSLDVKLKEEPTSKSLDEKEEPKSKSLDEKEEPRTKSPDKTEDQSQKSPNKSLTDLDLDKKDTTTTEGRTSPSSPVRMSMDLPVPGLSSIDEDKTPRFPQGGRKRRSSVAVPYQISCDSSSSVGRSSVSGDSIHTPSLRRMSLPSGTGLVPSSSSLSSSRGGTTTTTTKKVIKPPRRARAMSKEFRLADFSMMVKSLDSAGGGTRSVASEGSVDADKIASFGMPQLEADIAALQTHKQQEERKKAERLASKRHRRKSVIAEDPDATDGKHGKKDGKGVDPLAKGYHRGRRGSTVSKLSGRQVSQLTRANLAMLEAVHRGKWHKSSYANRSSKGPKDAGKLGLGHHLGKYGIKSDEYEVDAGPTKDYSTLTFQEKLKHDSKKLSRIPILSPAQLEPRIAIESLRENTFSIGPKLPDIKAGVHLKHLEALSISKPFYKGYGLGETNFREKHRLLIGAISADKLAGGPLFSFLQRREFETELSYLKFWLTSQEYLMTGTYISDIEGCLSRHKLARQIKASFLTQTGECYISLGDQLAKELCEQLPRDIADELLVHAQNLSCEALKDCFQDFQRSDREEFLSKTTSRKNYRLDAYSRTKARPTAGLPDYLPQKGSTDSLHKIETSSHLINQLVNNARENTDGGRMGKTELEEGTVNAVAPYRMWRALQLAETASRAVADSAGASDPSDPDSDSEDEGSLRRKLTTVYRKRKPKPVKDVKPRQSYDVIRRRDVGIHRVLQSRESKHVTDEDSSGAGGKAVCRVIRKDGRTIQRPPRPKTFQDVLRDTSHQEFLKRFLVQKKADLPLLFWQAVDNMKSTSRDAKGRQSRTIMIVRKFFCKATDFGGALQCDAEIIQDIPSLEKVTPPMLLSAQACVAKSLEEKWFEQYQDTFPEEASDEENEDGSGDEEQRLPPRQKNKALWAMFINNVTSFRRGLMSTATLNAFKTFFSKEVQRELEKQKQTGVQSRRMISNKVIIVEKLQNDLSFWAEVERFKELADSAARAAASGTYTIDDEEMVQRKAKALIDCYIDSQVPPKVQINITQEVADEILDIAANGLIERGIFHDAAVSIFAVLLYCWKKFCKERFAPSKKPSRSEVPTEPTKKKKRKRKRHPSTPRVAGVKIKTVTGASVDDPPKLQFSLQSGVQLILPPKPHVRERVRAAIRQLYPDAGSLDKHGDEKLLQLYQAAQQLHAQGSFAQRRMSRSVGQNLQMESGQLASLLPGGATAL